jgi:hypothetical protein
MSDFRDAIRWVACAAFAATAACSAPSSEPSQSEPAATAEAQGPRVSQPAGPPLDVSDTVGGDGSPILLTAVSSADLDSVKLAGELGCSFASPSVSPLLVAMGDVASQTPAQGVVKIGDYVERVSARNPGGFDAMVKGATFVGQGKMVTVALTGAPPASGGESPAYPATLTYDRADGARRVIDGFWTCGP